MYKLDKWSDKPHSLKKVLNFSMDYEMIFLMDLQNESSCSWRRVMIWCRWMSFSSAMQTGVESLQSRCMFDNLRFFFFVVGFFIDALMISYQSNVHCLTFPLHHSATVQQCWNMGKRYPFFGYFSPRSIFFLLIKQVFF